jgi:hypothetical protein
MRAFRGSAGSRTAAGWCCVFSVMMASAQQPALHVKVLEGNRAAHSLRSNTSAVTVIEVRDASNAPVAGARVKFEAPATGPGGVFVNGETQIEVPTNTNGRAATIGFVPNGRPGEFPVEVTVSAQGAVQHLTVWQSNSLDRFYDGMPAVRSGWKWWLVGLAAGGGAVGLTFALRGGSGPSRTIWTPGPPDIGPPR